MQMLSWVIKYKPNTNQIPENTNQIQLNYKPTLPLIELFGEGVVNSFKPEKTVTMTSTMIIIIMIIILIII